MIKGLFKVEEYPNYPINFSTSMMFACITIRGTSTDLMQVQRRALAQCATLPRQLIDRTRSEVWWQHLDVPIKLCKTISIIAVITITIMVEKSESAGQHSTVEGR
jgi:hypothetical protein